MRIIIITLLIAVSTTLVGQTLKIYSAKVGDEMAYEDIMVALNGGCSLGCAIGWTLNSTSNLSTQGTSTYEPENMNDGNKNTAWVEGKRDYGIGEKIIVQFSAIDGLTDIPFDQIFITNGYAKSPSIWEDNSRVKLIKVYHNGNPKFIIKLEDTIYPQWVSWDETFNISESDKVELEILEVYPGNKFKDTAISDLSLNGAH